MNGEDFVILPASMIVEFDAVTLLSLHSEHLCIETVDL